MNSKYRVFIINRKKFRKKARFTTNLSAQAPVRRAFHTRCIARTRGGARRRSACREGSPSLFPSLSLLRCARASETRTAWPRARRSVPRWLSARKLRRPAPRPVAPRESVQQLTATARYTERERERERKRSETAAPETWDRRRRHPGTRRRFSYYWPNAVRPPRTAVPREWGRERERRTLPATSKFVRADSGNGARAAPVVVARAVLPDPASFHLPPGAICPRLRF